MTVIDPHHVAGRSRLARAVLGLLRRSPRGISEHDLLQHLVTEKALEPFNYYDPVTLFHSHFLLFHTLYSLRGRLVALSGWSLEISPLQIQLIRQPGRGDNLLANADPLCEYYADFKHLSGTTPAEILSMLDRFWKRQKFDAKRQQALAQLGLADPVEDSTIKMTYRRLVMRHHPDRGGCPHILQELNEAIKILL